MPKRDIVNPPPAGIPNGAPKDAVNAEFARRLQQALVARGWSQSDLARRVRDHMPEGDGRVGRDNISRYIRGVSLPRPTHLAALCRALGMRPEELLPAEGRPTGGVIGMEVRETADGNVWLRVNQATDWDTALEVQRLLKGKRADD